MTSGNSISGGSRKTRIETETGIWSDPLFAMYKWWFQKNKD